MARVKGGIISAKRRRNVLAQVKGYRFGRSKKERMAKEAITKAGKYSFAHRKDKKNDYRKLFAVRIGAGLAGAISYSKFIGNLKKQNITINRKMLAQLAAEHPKAFEAILAKAK